MRSFLLISLWFGLLLAGCAKEEKRRVEIFEVADLRGRDFSDNEYPDLLVAASVRVNGEPSSLLVPVLDNRKELDTVGIRVGDVLEVDIVAVEAVAERWARAQRIDELRVPASNEWFGMDPVFISRGPLLSRDEAFEQRWRDDKRRRTDASRTEIFAAFDRNGKSMDAWAASLQNFRNNSRASVLWPDGISDVEAEAIRAENFREPVSPVGISPVNAIAQLSEQLEAKGLSFIYLSIPLRSEIYPEWFGGDPGLETGVARLDLLRTLGEMKVEFFDAGEVLKREKAARGDKFRPFWQAKDAHLTPEGHQVVATAFTDYLEENRWLERLKKSEFETQRIEISAPKRPDLTMLVRQVPVPKTNPDSPIFVAGDSNLFFYQTVMAKGCGFPSQLAAEAGHYVDWKSIAGMQPHTFAKYDPGVFGGKKLVVFLHSAWLLHDSRSPMMPVKLQ